MTADLAGLGKDAATYSLFTNPKGGIIDDTIIANRGDWIYVVVNAGCFDKDKAHIDAAAFVFVLPRSIPFQLPIDFFIFSTGFQV